MSRLALFGGLVLALSLADGAADDKKDVPKELAPFQGTWKVTKAERGGKAVDDVKLQFTFDGTKIDYLQNEKGTGDGSFVIDAKKVPAEIDLIDKKGAKSRGIYKFENENSRLIICFTREERPKKFDSTDAPGAVLLTLEKVKK